MFEEVVVPPNTPVPLQEGEMPIPISSLDEVSSCSTSLHSRLKISLLQNC